MSTSIRTKLFRGKQICTDTTPGSLPLEHPYIRYLVGATTYLVHSFEEMINFLTEDTVLLFTEENIGWKSASEWPMLHDIMNHDILIISLLSW